MESLQRLHFNLSLSQAIPTIFRKMASDRIKQIAFIFLASCCVEVSFAQTPPGISTSILTRGNGHITGIALDSLTQKPVEFANVALVDPSTNKPLNGTVCDEKGRFAMSRIPKGNFLVVISFIGYETKKIAVVITDKRNEIDLGFIRIGPTAKMLQEVVVQGQKTLIEEKVDRTIYNAEQDATTRGGDATDVLKRVPMLSVDMDGNVSLRGSQNVKVLINNKPSTITANSVADALKQIPADMIKMVEVITSPSSKYDAEGSAGIINIVLKKNTLEGLFFTANGSVGSRGSSLGVNGNYRKGKMGISLGSFARGTYRVIGNFANRQTTRSKGDTILNIQSAHTYSNGSNSQQTFSWDYDINKNNSLTASSRYGQRSQSSYQDQLFTQTYRHDSLFSKLQNIKTTTIGSNVDASLNYTKAFSKKDREFNFLTIYSRSNQTSGFVTNTVSEADQSVLSRIKNENQGHTQEVTFQADYQEPLRKNQLLELGGKDVIRSVTSQYRTWNAITGDDPYVLSANPSLSNGFNYAQSITAGYVLYTLTTENNYTLKGGGRYEYAHISAHFDGQPDIKIPSYGVLVPSINISRKLKNGNMIKASYNRRIQRPSLRDLNPNIVSSNSISATQGNPNLKPEYADNYELAYKTGIKASTINFSAFVRNNTNDIQQARSVVGGTILSIYQNIGTEANYGLSIFASIVFSSRFTINGGTDMYYRVLKNNSNDPFINARNQGLVRNYRLFGNYNFSKDWSVQFFSFFQGRSINLQGYRTNPINHSLSMRKDVMGKKGTIAIGIDNFMTPSYRVYSELKSAYLVQSTSDTLYNFILRANFSYKIGKLNPDKVDSRKKAPTEEEVRDN